jgi:glycosyltransferase involved in cell wall biosynthesis
LDEILMPVPTKVGKPRLLFCSFHSYLDPSSGAALSTRDLLELLAAHGWECASLSGPQLDFQYQTAFEDVLKAQKVSFQFRPGQVADVHCTLYHYVRNGVAIHAFVPNDWVKRTPTREEGKAFLHLFDRVQQRFAADILLTFGGHWLAAQLNRRAKQRGMKVVFSLRNFEYQSAEVFQDVDAVLVPSQAVQNHYRDKFGLSSRVIAGPWDWEQVSCPDVEGRYVTFINPLPHKGVFWFARIAHELNRRRPDIPLLVVEGRADVNWLARGDLDLSGLTNLHRMANTPDPRQFYRVSRMVLMPSLWAEAFGRVAVEAHINGIPVLASRRGGIPEALAGAGFLFDIPARYTPQVRLAPTAAEVAPWIETIERLWDDQEYYQAESERCRRAAQIWRPERLYPRFADFFQQLLNPPLPRTGDAQG